MNLAPKPVVYAISLSLLCASSLLSGCAGKQPAVSHPDQSIPTAATEPAGQSDSGTRATPGQQETSSQRNEPKAIPFEEVLKRDQEAAARKPAQRTQSAKPAQPTQPTEQKIDTTLRSKVRTNPPLRPASDSPAETQPQQKALDAAQDTPPPAATEQKITAIQFALDQLPITIQNTWILSGHQNHCSLKTVAVTMDDGAGKTPLYLELTNSAWMIQTKSDIDSTYPDTGLFLSNGPHIPLESVVKDTKIAITKQKQQLTDALKTAESVRVALGFWPTWPITETRSQTIPVAHFPQAYAAWETCNQRITAR